MLAFEKEGKNRFTFAAKIYFRTGFVETFTLFIILKLFT